MKKAVALFCTLAILILPSCTKGIFAPTPERITEFSADVKITFGEKLFSGKLICSSPCAMKLTFSEPEQIGGFSVTYTGNGFSCDVLGIEDSIPWELTSDGSCLKLFFRALKAALFDTVELTPNAANDFNARLQDIGFCAVYDRNGRLKLIYSDVFSISADFFSIDL